uniref:Cartilage intermediate layer protein 1-like isoform X1 n=2 Tax=Saccoglossus kowalevskii TaxID=10224 RepID=A0ABM0MMS3_SACKO|nr:PREDICTED: cartilage intermediate layer protein 1-like isoform X1 [Saccoglossus kowalevskii]
MFCCNGYGNPNPSYYEWFKDNNILEDWSYSTNTSLILENLNISDAGTYTCRVNSDAGAAFSIPAVLQIHDTADTCSRSLRPNYIQLPDGCTGPNGTNQYDTGMCSRSKCSGDPGNGADRCTDTEKYCCVESNTEQRQLTCRDFTISIIVVTGCKCDLCSNPTKVVSGRALSADTKEPLAYGDVFIGYEFVRKTTFNGEFIFNVPEGRQRLSVTFHDGSKELADATKVITITDTIKYYIVVFLQRRAPTVTFNASETTILDVGNATQPSIELEIPPMSIRTGNGTLYTGNVTASVNFIDPRDSQIVDTIQSDLSTRDVEGNVQNLNTFGMVSMNFEDDSGDPLDVDGSIKIYVDAEKANLNITEIDENMLPRLWLLNAESGEWEDIGGLRLESSKRRKRDIEEVFIVGDIEVTGISINSIWCNIDSIERLDQVCFLKVRVYDDEQLTVPMDNVEVTAITNDLDIRVARTNRGLRYSGGKFNFFDKKVTQVGQTCLRVFCDSTGLKFYLNVRAKYDDKVCTPVSPLSASVVAHPNTWPSEIVDSYTSPDIWDDTGFITMSGRKNPNADGPIYSSDVQTWSGMRNAEYRCNAADYIDNHLIFRKNQEQNINDLFSFNTQPYTFSEASYSQSRVPCSWYPIEGQLKRVCFIKILVDGPNSSRFRVISAKDPGNVNVDCDEYGFRVASTPENQINAFGTKSAVCIEFKCSGDVRVSNNAEALGASIDGIIGQDLTTVKVIPDATSSTCFLQNCGR